MKGPPFNSIVDLTRLSHEEYITKAKEGYPPLGVLSPTMQSHIDGLEVIREPYASSTNPMRKQSPQSESSYNGSVLTEVTESINGDKLPTVAGSIQLTKEKTVTKKAAKAMKVKFRRLSLRD